MATRSLTRTIPQVVGGVYTPDTGLVVKLVDAVGGTDITTATETPAGSGNYVAVWTPSPVFGYWKVGSTTKTEWGRVWLGVEGQLRPTYIFKKVKFYDAGDTPTGAKGAAKTMVSGTSPLAVDVEGNAPPTFTNVPIIAIVKLYQERGYLISTDPTLSGGNVSFGISAGDAGDNNGDGKCYADVVVISMD